MLARGVGLDRPVLWVRKIDGAIGQWAATSHAVWAGPARHRHRPRRRPPHPSHPSRQGHQGPQ
ncbi:MAG: hypothetical protein WKG07_35885 [Hymenobacter sp.]